MSERARRGAVRPPAMVDVARLAEVSQKTVSRVVNGEPNVSADVRERVQAAIEELGFRPNGAARALVTARSRVIGFVSTGSALFGPSQMAVGVEQAAREAGYAVAVVHTRSGDPSDVGDALDELAARGVDGIVVSEPADSLRPVHRTPAGVPVLALEHRPEESDEWILVGADDRAGARAATEHLLGLGHRTVWHVAGPQGWGTTQNRRIGWEEALVESGCPVPEVIRGDWSPASGYEAGVVLATRPDLTAVFVANDDMAIGLVRALERAGLSVPRDVSVVGFDDVAAAAYQHVPLTTVRQDFAEISRQGMRRLLAAIEGRPVPSRRTAVPVHLVVRDSTAAPHPDRGPVRPAHPGAGAGLSIASPLAGIPTDILDEEDPS
ncbi:LacI family DNA-binding transcriptional regulator [Isoptericola sp. NPDC019693]|uniref:LacI family DNA-binding transcriptional regulator n=1 Tax=Isoptericola sp. NPDC019693 TaxID=3364009 RepID=UPI0037B16717